MSIALATKGRLWPVSVVIREQFHDIAVDVVDPVVLAVVIEDESLVSNLVVDDTVVEVMTIDTISGVVVDDNVSVEIGEC